MTWMGIVSFSTQGPAWICLIPQYLSLKASFSLSVISYCKTNTPKLSSLKQKNFYYFIQLLRAPSPGTSAQLDHSISGSLIWLQASYWLKQQCLKTKGFSSSQRVFCRATWVSSCCESLLYPRVSEIRERARRKQQCLLLTSLRSHTLPLLPDPVRSKSLRKVHT